MVKPRQHQPTSNVTHITERYKMATKSVARKPRAKAPENETAAERFVRLAESRVSNALTALKQIGNLTGPSYEYTPEQIEKIMEALNRAYEEMEARFKSPSSTGKPKLFSL